MSYRNPKVFLSVISAVLGMQSLIDKAGSHLTFHSPRTKIDDYGRFKILYGLFQRHRSNYIISRVRGNSIFQVAFKTDVYKLQGDTVTLNDEEITLPMHKTYRDGSQVKIEDIGKVKTQIYPTFGNSTVLTHN